MNLGPEEWTLLNNSKLPPYALARGTIRTAIETGLRNYWDQCVIDFYLTFSSVKPDDSKIDGFNNGAFDAGLGGGAGVSNAFQDLSRTKDQVGAINVYLVEKLLNQPVGTSNSILGGKTILLADPVTGANDDAAMGILVSHECGHSLSLQDTEQKPNPFIGSLNNTASIEGAAAATNRLLMTSAGARLTRGQFGGWLIDEDVTGGRPSKRAEDRMSLLFGGPFGEGG